MRALSIVLAILLALCAPARAQMLLSGAGPSCPSPTANGSVISPSNTACTLVDSGGNVWNFDVLSSHPPNHFLDFNGQQFFLGLQAEMCGNSGFVAYDQSWSSITYWFNQIASDNVQGSAACTPSLGNFTNVTTATSYNTAHAALNAVAASQTLHFPAAPVGIPNWRDGGTIAANSVTVNIDSGAVFDGAISASPPGQAQLVITGNGAVLNGGLWQNAGNPGDDVSGIKIDTGALTPTLENLTLTGTNGTCLLSGGNNGASAITDVVVHNCGLNNNNTGGQNHNVYLSEPDTQTSPSNWTVTGLDSYDVTGGTSGINGDGGWTLKIRAGAATVIGDAAHYYIGCQAGTAPQCEQNGAIDFPCGGAFAVSHMVVEVGPGGDNWYVIRQGEETPGGPPNCPTLGTYADTLTVDSAVIIWDAPGTGNPGFIPVVCGGNGACLLSASFTTCVKNSIIVSNPSAPFSLSLGPNVTDCGAGGNSNQFFASRTAAATALGWSGTDKFGNPCCAFPWVPPKP